MGIVRRGDCMFIEKARQLESVQAAGGIIIDHNTSLKSSNNAIFSMTGDGYNNVHIPVVLMFKDEAFQLLHLLSKDPNLIVYIGDEKYFRQSFYQQTEWLEYLMKSSKPTSRRWIYGQRWNFCPLISKALREYQNLVDQPMEIDHSLSQPIIQIEHIIEADGKKSVEEITSELFASLNLTAINFGGQFSSIEAYRSALDKMFRSALTSTNRTNSQDVETAGTEEVSTTTADTREYTEKRSETEKKN